MITFSEYREKGIVLNLEEMQSRILNPPEFRYPEVIGSILICFRAFGQYGEIVGGAVRDFVLGKEIRDYDVYINGCYDPVGDMREVGIQAKRFGYSRSNMTTKADYENENIIVYNLYNGTTNIDIIFGKQTVQEFVSEFTCDISKISYDVFKNEIKRTVEFISTVESKISRINDRRDAQKSTTDLYVDKMRKKYPEFTFVEE